MLIFRRVSGTAGRAGRRGGVGDWLMRRQLILTGRSACPHTALGHLVEAIVPSVHAWRQWRLYTRASEVKWPAWKIHRPGSRPA